MELMMLNENLEELVTNNNNNNNNFTFRYTKIYFSICI